jgi:hypothetical protein
MNDHLFESFCVMIDGLPIKAVMRAAMVQCHMLEDDLAKGWIPPNVTAASILSFAFFLNRQLTVPWLSYLNCRWNIRRFTGKSCESWLPPVNCS